MFRKLSGKVDYHETGSRDGQATEIRFPRFPNVSKRYFNRRLSYKSGFARFAVFLRGPLFVILRKVRLLKLHLSLSNRHHLWARSVTTTIHAASCYWHTNITNSGASLSLVCLHGIKMHPLSALASNCTKCTSSSEKS